MEYKVNLKETEGGFAVWVPGLPGCWSQGEKEKEAICQQKLADLDELRKSVLQKVFNGDL